MTLERQRELNTTPGAKLTQEELIQGWHFCSEFDEDLIQGCDTPGKRYCSWCDFSGERYEIRLVAEELLANLDNLFAEYTEK